MSEIVITLEDAAHGLPELVERIHANGEPALIVKSGQALARIVPVPPKENGTGDLILFLRSWQAEHPEPDDQFAEAIAESRKSIEPQRDPWE